MSDWTVIRDLDDVGAVEPVATLGGELPDGALTNEEKKKQKKKKQKVHSTAQYKHTVHTSTQLTHSHLYISHRNKSDQGHVLGLSINQAHCIGNASAVKVLL